MLNRQLSSSKRRNEEMKTKSPRSPLRNLNGFAGSHCGRSTCSSTSSSSSPSVEISRGCLRLLLPSSSASKTPLRRSKAKIPPKSAPNGKSSNPSSSSRSNRPLKENLPKPNLGKEKIKKTPHYLYQIQRGKKQNSKASLKPMPSTSTSGSLRDNLVFGSAQLTPKQCDVPIVDESGVSPKILKLPNLNIVAERYTPIAKVECGSDFTCGFDCNPVEESSTPNTVIKTITPPVQASVSPEIQCGSSMLTTTRACYGAGHIVSGVTDRRKCRAKGLLTVGQTATSCAKAHFFDNSDDVETVSKPRSPLVPLPAEASMLWLSSPWDKEDDYQTSDLENGTHYLRTSFGANTLHCVSSPSSGHRASCMVFENSSSSTSCGRRTKINLLSPSGTPTYHVAASCEARISQEKGKRKCDLAREDSPFSIDSLGSGNVIQTPQSDLKSDSHVRLSWLNSHYPQNNNLGSGIDSLETALLRASLSPKKHISISDPPCLNFQISDLISPTNSIELMQSAKKWDNRASSTSNSSLDSMSPSHMRISSGEGLSSRIFEMDEFECLRCLSDDENDVIECSVTFKCSPNHEFHFDVGSGAVHCNDFGSSNVGPESKSDREPKEKFSEQPSNPCAESMCTDGSGLFSSADSDWTLCYKNQLFEL